MESAETTSGDGSVTASGRVLCFTSAKGGSGKTVFAASTAYALLRAGKRVLCVDADFSTRGLSLLLLSSLIDTGDLHLKSASCLAEAVLTRLPVQKLKPLTVVYGEIEFSVLVTNRNLQQGGIPEDRLLGNTKEGTSSHFVDVAVEDYYSYFKELCTVMRGFYDYVVVDTRGGFDTTTVVPAIVADAYCIVLEADEISVQQVYGLKTKIDEYAQRLEGQGKLRGFIVNKALYSPTDKGFVSTVARIYGGQPLGTVPADKLAIKAYQRKNLAFEVAPESDFAFYSFQVINNLVGADQQQWTKTETLAMAEMGRHIRKLWRFRTLLESVDKFNPYVALILLVLTSVGYIGATRTDFNWVRIGFYIVASITALWCVAVVLLNLFARWRQTDLFKARRWMLTAASTAMVLLFGGLVYLTFFDVPAVVSNNILYQKLSEQSKLLAVQDAQLRATQSSLNQAKAELMIAKLDQTKTKAACHAPNRLKRLHDVPGFTALICILWQKGCGILMKPIQISAGMRGRADSLPLNPMLAQHSWATRDKLAGGSNEDTNAV